MRYIFIIQGEGRGHLTQAITLSQLLQANGHSVVEVLVGKCKNRELPSFFTQKINAPVTLFDSPTIDYGQNGKRGNIFKTLFSNTTPSKIKRWRKSLNTIVKHIEESEADIIINFYEVLLGAAAMLNTIKQPIICIGHQFIVDHPQFVHRAKFDGGSLLLRMNNLVCSYGAYKRLALSFYPLGAAYQHRIEVVPPLLRNEIFTLESTREDFTLGYMLNPAYLNEVLAWKEKHPDAQVHLFWDQKGAPDCEEREKGLWLHKINDMEFLNLMARCKGYVTTAGFESVCEALYLGKPTLMIPAHVEQQINAADAHGVGAGEVAEKFDLSLLDDAIAHYSADTQSFREWVDGAQAKFLNALTTL